MAKTGGAGWKAGFLLPDILVTFLSAAAEEAVFISEHLSSGIYLNRKKLKLGDKIIALKHVCGRCGCCQPRNTHQPLAR